MDGQTDMTKLTVAFSNANTSNNFVILTLVVGITYTTELCYTVQVPVAVTIHRYKNVPNRTGSNITHSDGKRTSPFQNNTQCKCGVLRTSHPTEELSKFSTYKISFICNVIYTQNMHNISSYGMPKLVGEELVHLLCVYYSTRKVGFIN